MAAAKALAPATAMARGNATAEGSLRTHDGVSDLTKLMRSITAQCGDDEPAARRMLLARLRSRHANQSGGDATADRDAVVDASHAAARAAVAAPGKRRLASGDKTADDAAPTTAKKPKPGPSAPVTPDDTPAAGADPGAPKDASAPVVSPELSSGSQASYQPPAASLLAKRRAAQHAALPAAKKPKPESSG